MQHGESRTPSLAGSAGGDWSSRLLQKRGKAPTPGRLGRAITGVDLPMSQTLKHRDTDRDET